MSYFNLKPAYYEMNQPSGPWHAGSRGWTKSPWVTWGGNPNQVGPAWQGVDGLSGCAPCAAAGLGLVSMTAMTKTLTAPAAEAARAGPPAWLWAVLIAGGGLTLYAILKK